MKEAKGTNKADNSWVEEMSEFHEVEQLTAYYSFFQWIKSLSLEKRYAPEYGFLIWGIVPNSNKVVLKTYVGLSQLIRRAPVLRGSKKKDWKWLSVLYSILYWMPLLQEALLWLYILSICICWPNILFSCQFGTWILSSLFPSLLSISSPSFTKIE